MRINTKVVTDIRTGKILERHSFEHLGKIARAMGVRLGSVFTTTFIGPLPANANETIVCTTGPIGQAVDNAAILLFWMFSYVAGTTNSAALFTLRRGTTLTGAAIGAGLWGDQVVAAAPSVSCGVYVDTPGVVAGQQYTLTIQQVAATGAGTFRDVMLLAMVL